MGLIKSTINAVGGTLHDQWKEVIVCNDMTNDILMKKVTTETGVITKNSLIRVMPGQCAVIIKNGNVLDATAEDGDYNFDENGNPSFFAGNFGKVFKDMWERFTYGGDSANKYAVYYFNVKEIINNNFGTSNPIPYQDWSHPVPNQISGGLLPLAVKVKCYGKYTFKISNPSLFMRTISGTADIYTKGELNEQIRSEVMSVFQNILNELGTQKFKVPVLELPSQTDEIKEIMDEKVYDDILRNRGLSIVTFAIESLTLDEKSEEFINNYILGANVNMQQGTLVGAYADAVKDAANNANGATNGFMGVGMMNMAGGNVFGNAIQNTASKANTDTSIKNDDDEKWECPNCKKESKGNFCSNCGAKKPENKE